MPQQGKNKALPAESRNKSSPGIGMWIGIIVGSFLLVNIGTFFMVSNSMKGELTKVSTETDRLTSIDTISTDGVQDKQVTDPSEERSQTEPVESEPDAESPIQVVEDISVENREQEEQKESMRAPSNAAMQAENIPEEPPSATPGEIRQNEESTKPAEPEKNYRQLAKIYSQMDSKTAAEILSRLDEKMVVGIINNMRDRDAANLLTAFGKDKAARISEALSVANTSG